MECIRLILSDYYRIWPLMQEKSSSLRTIHLLTAQFFSASFMVMFWFRIVSFLPPHLDNSFHSYING